ncbi:MAG: hypothetical protein KDB88_03070 [Flavobacteriales bacterium]|nr:hypothetical protein [Flavobacteriales bacterium]
MRSQVIKHSMAVLFLGLMCSLVLPKGWLHSCDAHHHRAIEHGRSVSATEDCPICDAVLHSFVAEEPEPVLLSWFLLGSQEFGEVRAWFEAAVLTDPTRGPPVLG